MKTNSISNHLDYKRGKSFSYNFMIIEHLDKISDIRSDYRDYPVF